MLVSGHQTKSLSEIAKPRTLKLYDIDEEAYKSDTIKMLPKTIKNNSVLYKNLITFSSVQQTYQTLIEKKKDYDILRFLCTRLFKDLCCLLFSLEYPCDFYTFFILKYKTTYINLMFFYKIKSQNFAFYYFFFNTLTAMFFS